MKRSAEEKQAHLQRKLRKVQKKLEKAGQAFGVPEADPANLTPPINSASPTNSIFGNDVYTGKPGHTWW